MQPHDVNVNPRHTHTTSLGTPLKWGFGLPLGCLLFGLSVIAVLAAVGFLLTAAPSAQSLGDGASPSSQARLVPIIPEGHTKAPPVSGAKRRPQSPTASRRTSPSPQTASKVPRTRPEPDYARIQIGMTVAEMDGFLGVKGEKRAGASTPQGKRETYEWPINGEKTVSGTFLDGKLAEWELVEGIRPELTQEYRPKVIRNKPQYAPPLQNTTPPSLPRIEIPPIQPL